MSGREWVPTTAQVKDSTSLDGATALDEAEFDRWLAQHDAEVAGKALRDAAEATRTHTMIGQKGQWTTSQRPVLSADVREWLVARATKIETQQ